MQADWKAVFREIVYEEVFTFRPDFLEWKRAKEAAKFKLDHPYTVKRLNRL